MALDGDVGQIECSLRQRGFKIDVSIRRCRCRLCHPVYTFFSSPNVSLMVLNCFMAPAIVLTDMYVVDQLAYSIPV